MKILVLGDVMGLSGRKAIKKIFQKLLKKKLIFQLLMVKTLLMMEKE